MKKFALTMPSALLVSLAFLFCATACSDGDKGSEMIKVADKSELEQTLSGDQQTSTLSFVAASDWTSAVSEITPPHDQKHNIVDNA